MQTIHKFPAGGSHDGRNVGLSQRFTLKLPEGAEILTVQLQDEQPQLWAIVDVDPVLTDERSFRWFATGEECGSIGDTYIGTVQWGRFVFHLFEVES